MFIISFVLLIIIVVCYLYLKWKHTYWKRLGIITMEPDFFYGNGKESCKGQISLDRLFRNLYRQTKKKGQIHAGLYLFYKPIYVPVDLELIKNILTRDFDYFTDHGLFHNDKSDPLMGHLFNLEGEKWKKMRAKMTPSFSSGKMRMMFQTILKHSIDLNEILTEHAINREPVDIKDVLYRFTTDIIGSVAFGLNCNSLKNPNSKFIKYGKKVVDLDFKARIRRLVTFLFPENLLKSIMFKEMDKEVEDFFINIIKRTVKFREENKISIKDFMHLMIQLKNRGKLASDEFITKQEGEVIGTDFITFNELAAQCFLFFFAGFETSAATMTFALMELARNKDIQEKLRIEIKSVLQKFNGEVTYDGIQEMKYLDLVISEILRLYPPVSIIPRKCTKQYQIPGTNLTIEKDMLLMIPIMEIQRDSNYYPDPEQFDPERFTDENVAQRHSCTFLSFGAGPRYCLGSRFGLLESKIGIISVLTNFQIDLHEKTQFPLQYISSTVFLSVKGGIWLKLTKI